LAVLMNPNPLSAMSFLIVPCGMAATLLPNEPQTSPAAAKRPGPPAARTATALHRRGTDHGPRSDRSCAPWPPAPSSAQQIGRSNQHRRTMGAQQNPHPGHDSIPHSGRRGSRAAAPPCRRRPRRGPSRSIGGGCSTPSCTWCGRAASGGSCPTTSPTGSRCTPCSGAGGKPACGSDSTMPCARRNVGVWQADRAHRGDHRQPIRSHGRRRRGPGVRCRKEDHRPQASPGGRHARVAVGGGRAWGRLAGS
jgi:hypothetical protein